jgi:hypothetical protein
MDPKVGLDDVEKRKFLTLPGLELQPVADYDILIVMISQDFLNESEENPRNHRIV